MGDFWKPTADMFGSLIEKPRMTDRLLSKPPFKYIFDIVMETIKKTGCGNGKTYDSQVFTQVRKSMLISTLIEIRKYHICRRLSNLLS